MNFNRKIVVATLVVSSVFGMFDAVATHLQLYLFFKMGMTQLEAAIYRSYMSVEGEVIKPLTFFVISYLLGRDVDVKAELRSTIASIFVGCFIGYSVGFGIGYPTMLYLATGELFPMSGTHIILFILMNTLTSLIPTISLFFVSFSAMSIAYMRTHQKNLSYQHPQRFQPDSQSHIYLPRLPMGLYREYQIVVSMSTGFTIKGTFHSTDDP